MGGAGPLRIRITARAAERAALAVKTATPTMGGVRVRSPYKQLTGCNGGHCGVG
jgi:hypothetical protein